MATGHQLHKLALQGQLAALEELLKKSSPEEINEKDNIGHSPLIYAIGREQVEAVRLLLEYGADPNNKDIKGITPLAFVADPQPIRDASAQKRLEIAQLLLDKGADLSLQNNAGNQPLWVAVFSASDGNTEKLSLVELMLRHGADMHHKNNAGNSPLDFAKKVGWKPLLDVLEKKQGQNA